MTNDVAIIGVGLHPFGRFDKPAVQMGAEAIRLALTDAGVAAMRQADLIFQLGEELPGLVRDARR